MDNLNYTHELVLSLKKVYPMNVLEIGNVINHDFEEIDNIRIINLGDGIKLLEVSGKVHLYGYKVENGGFFDLINSVYYNENSNIFKNGLISELDKSPVQKRKK